MGDGGDGGDPLNNGQSPGTLLGKLLRIDVESGAQPYRVPPDNPFLLSAGFLPEIWALGLRNPWRFSFDRGTRDLCSGRIWGIRKNGAAWDNAVLADNTGLMITTFGEDESGNVYVVNYDNGALLQILPP